MALLMLIALVAAHYNTAIKVRRLKVMGYILDIGVGVMDVQDKPSWTPLPSN